MLEVLEDIGRRLREEIKPQAPNVSEDGLPRGAGGDASHPVDIKAEKIILEGLEASGEPFDVISEEAGMLSLNGGGGRVVIIDPVDGSRNAVAGIPFYCTSIAVAEGPRLEDVRLAYVLNLASGDEFWARAGGGAFLNGKPAATQADDIFRLVEFDAHVPGRDMPVLMPLLSEARKARCLGSTALALSYLAAGSASLFTVPTRSRSFDFAAGWLLVKEAGGLFTDIEGNDPGHIELGLSHISTILASANAALHEKALRLLGARQ